MQEIIVKFTDESERTRWYVETFISYWLDFGFGYDMQDEAMTAIKEVLEELDLDYEVIGDDDDL